MQEGQISENAAETAQEAANDETGAMSYGEAVRRVLQAARGPQGEERPLTEDVIESLLEPRWRGKGVRLHQTLMRMRRESIAVLHQDDAADARCRWVLGPRGQSAVPVRSGKGHQELTLRALRTLALEQPIQAGHTREDIHRILLERTDADMTLQNVSNGLHALSMDLHVLQRFKDGDLPRNPFRYSFFKKADLRGPVLPPRGQRATDTLASVCTPEPATRADTQNKGAPATKAKKKVDLPRDVRVKLYTESTLTALRELSAVSKHPTGVTAEDVRELLRTAGAAEHVRDCVSSYLNRLCLMGLATKTPIPGAGRGESKMRYLATGASTPTVATPPAPPPPMVNSAPAHTSVSTPSLDETDESNLTEYATADVIEQALGVPSQTVRRWSKRRVGAVPIKVNPAGVTLFHVPTVIAWDAARRSPVDGTLLPGANLIQYGAQEGTRRRSATVAAIMAKYGVTSHGSERTEARAKSSVAASTPFAEASTPFDANEQTYAEIVDELSALRTLGEQIARTLLEMLALWQR